MGTENCPYCGFDNPEGSSYCGNCAENVLESYSISKSRKVYKQEKRSHRTLEERKKAAPMIGFVVAGILVAVIVVFPLFLKTSEMKESPFDNRSVTKEITSVTPKQIKYVGNLKSKFSEYKIVGIGVTTDFKTYKFNVYMEHFSVQIPMDWAGNSISAEQVKKGYAGTWEGATSYSNSVVITENNVVVLDKTYVIDAELKEFFKKYKLAVVTASNKELYLITEDNLIQKVVLNVIKSIRFGTEYRASLDKLKLQLPKNLDIRSAHYNMYSNHLFFTDGKTLTKIDRMLNEYSLKKYDLALFDTDVAAITFGKSNWWFLTDSGRIYRVNSSHIANLPELLQPPKPADIQPPEKR